MAFPPFGGLCGIPLAKQDFVPCGGVAVLLCIDNLLDEGLGFVSW